MLVFEALANVVVELVDVHKVDVEERGLNV
jgi:hypothetical protein